MSLARAFTTRKFRMSTNPSEAKGPMRAQTLRHKISAPVELVHTTNMLSYNAPDLPRAGRSNSTSTAEDSDSVNTADSTPPTSPDVGKDERSVSPEPNHLSGYFTAPRPVTPPSKTSVKTESEEVIAAPAIPKRSPSHTKKNSYDIIARSRSVSRTSKESDQLLSKQSQTFSRSPSRTSTRASSVSTTRSMKQPPPAPPAPLSLPTPTEAPAAPTAPAPKETHPVNPFGPELAQVTELAEEYNSSSQLELVDEDAEYLKSRGLTKLPANDYLSMIQGLSSMFFSESSHSASTAPLWI